MDALRKLARLAEIGESHQLQAQVEPERSWAELSSLSNASSDVLRATEAQGSQVTLDQAVRENEQWLRPCEIQEALWVFAPMEPATSKCVCTWAARLAQH